MSRRDSLCASAVAIQETELASSTAPADLVVDMDQQQDAHFAQVFARAEPGALALPPCDLTGLTAIVTGANQGIGYSCVQKLASMGALVFLACRDARKAAAAKAEILAAVPSALLDTSLTLDLASLASCRTFAQRFRALGIACDLLVHNGGAVIMRKSTTVDGLELAYQSNFLGSFLLTLELLPVIPSDGRIVLNSSTAAMDAQPLTAAKLCSPDLLDAFEETQPLSFRRSMQMYSRSKACQVLFAQELARRFRHSGRSSIVVTAVHPGVVASPVWSRAEYPPSRDLAERVALAQKVGLSCDDGADAILRALLIGDESGAFFDRGTRKSPPAWCADVRNAEAIWRRWEADAGVRLSDSLVQAKL